MTFEEAIKHPNFSHTRAKSWRRSGIILSDEDYIIRVYHKSSSSPTGVEFCGATCRGLDKAAALLDAAGRPFPLSPTEAR